MFGSPTYRVQQLLIFFLIVLQYGFSFKGRHMSVMRSARMQLFAQLGRVTMYKKDSCPHCKMATELLEGQYQLKINFVNVEEPNENSRAEILQQMRTFSGGRNTVPQIFFNAEHIGGNDDVQKLEKEGKLATKVEYVKKTPMTMMMDHWHHPWY